MLINYNFFNKDTTLKKLLNKNITSLSYFN